MYMLSGVLFSCVTCPITHCFDCWPAHYKRLEMDPEYNKSVNRREREREKEKESQSQSQNQSQSQEEAGQEHVGIGGDDQGDAEPVHKANSNLFLEGGSSMEEDGTPSRACTYYLTHQSTHA